MEDRGVRVVVNPGVLPPNTVSLFEQELRRRLLGKRCEVQVSVSGPGLYMSPKDPDLHGFVERVTAALQLEAWRSPDRFQPLEPIRG